MRHGRALREWVLVAVVALMSLSANLPQGVAERWGINREILLAALVGVLAVALVRYVRFALVLVIGILTVGANLPEALARELGIDQFVMITTLVAVIVVASLNYLVKWLPSGVEEAGLGRSSNQGVKAYFAAVARGDLRQVTKLVDLGVDINAQDQAGDTALIVAARRGYADVVQLLLHRGANPDVANRAGETPLRVAMSHGFTRTADLLRPGVQARAAS